MGLHPRNQGSRIPGLYLPNREDPQNNGPYSPKLGTAPKSEEICPNEQQNKPKLKTRSNSKKSNQHQQQNQLLLLPPPTVDGKISIQPQLKIKIQNPTKLQKMLARLDQQVEELRDSKHSSFQYQDRSQSQSRGRSRLPRSPRLQTHQTGGAGEEDGDQGAFPMRGSWDRQYGAHKNRDRY